MLRIGTGPSHDEEKSGPRLIVTDRNSHFTLDNDIWIERLDDQLAKHIQKACDPPHYNIGGVEHDRHLYAFVRRFPEVEKSNYEGMAELFGAITLSRLIHPTSIGDCAKVSHFGLTDSAIQAIRFTGMSPDVFLGDSHRDWLSIEDGEDLRRLVPWLSKDKSMHGARSPRIMDGPLFRPVKNNRTGTLDKYLDPGSVYRNIVTKYARETGISAEAIGVCVHSMRASAATNALSNQADIAKGQEWLGYANISIPALRPAQEQARGQSDV